MLQIHYNLAIIVENVPISSILVFLVLFLFLFLFCFVVFFFQLFYFLMYFYNSLISSVTFLFFPGEKNMKQPWGNLYKMCPRGQGRSFKSQNKIGTSHFNTL